MIRGAAAAAVAVLVAALGGGALHAVPAAADRGRPAVVEMRVIGYSVTGRPIRAWRLGDPDAVESGPAPASEPETRALMRFLRRVDPRFVVSFHQPMHGVDLWRAKRRWFVHRLADHLRLPTKEFACGSTCHGTLTQWFNHNFDGAAVTVEYAANPSRERMTLRAPGQLLRALGGRR